MTHAWVFMHGINSPKHDDEAFVWGTREGAGTDTTLLVETSSTDLWNASNADTAFFLNPGFDDFFSGTWLAGADKDVDPNVGWHVWSKRHRTSSRSIPSHFSICTYNMTTEDDYNSSATYPAMTTNDLIDL